MINTSKTTIGLLLKKANKNWVNCSSTLSKSINSKSIYNGNEKLNNEQNYEQQYHKRRFSHEKKAKIALAMFGLMG